MKSRILVATSTYNEADNILPLLEQIHEQLPDAHILVVDDNSPDGTGRMVRDYAQNNKHVFLIARRTKMGIGTAHKLAKSFAKKYGYGQLISMDADFSHHPRYLKTLSKLLESNDFVIGSRYTEGGSCNYGPMNRFVSRGANLLSRVLLGLKLRETTAGYRGYSKHLLDTLRVDTIKADGYSFFIESIYRVSCCTQKMAEFPIHFEDRRAGTSKISKAEVFRGLATVSRLFFERVRGALGLHSRRPVVSEVEDLRFTSCNHCSSPFHVELFSQTTETLNTGLYNCTSSHHASHGRIVKCLVCGLVYTNPLPTQATLEAMYAGVEDPTYIKHIPARERTFRYNLKQIQRFLPKGAELLDVGSYCGVFLRVAEELGYTALGLEPSKWAADYGTKNLGVRIVHGPIQRLDPRVKQFDVVTSWDVLEHFADPTTELARMYSLVKPNGVLALSTLDFSNWFPKVMGESWPWLMDMHLYYYSVDLLRDMFAKAGFELIHTRSYCHIISFSYFIQKLESLGVPGAGILSKLLVRTPLSRVNVPFQFGDIKLLVCRKLERPVQLNYGDAMASSEPKTESNTLLNRIPHPARELHSSAPAQNLA